MWFSHFLYFIHILSGGTLVHNQQLICIVFLCLLFILHNENILWTVPVIKEPYVLRTMVSASSCKRKQ